jgi:hypothetical protein
MKIKGIFGTEFQISSKTLAIIFGATGALLAALAAKAIPVPMGIPDVWADYAQSWANFLIKLWAPVGPTLLVLFSDSNPGPFAPQDPPVVQAATAKAVEMGQIAKSLFIAIVLIGAFGAFDRAHAKGRVNCTPGLLGCPPIHSAPAPAAGDVTPTPAPAPAPTSQPAIIQNVLEALIEVQGQFVADVNAADAEAIVLWPPTPAGGTAPAGQGSIDPIAHACYPTLAAWAQNLSLPVTPTAPTGQQGPVAIFEGLRVANIVAQGLIQQISSVGFPSSLTIACGGLITDSVTQEGKIAGEVTSFATMLATFIPKPILMKHNVAFLLDYQKPRGK